MATCGERASLLFVMSLYLEITSLTEELGMLAELL